MRRMRACPPLRFAPPRLPSELPRGALAENVAPPTPERASRSHGERRGGAGAGGARGCGFGRQPGGARPCAPLCLFRSRRADAPRRVARCAATRWRASRRWPKRSRRWPPPPPARRAPIAVCKGDADLVAPLGLTRAAWRAGRGRRVPAADAEHDEAPGEACAPAAAVGARWRGAGSSPRPVRLLCASCR